MRVLYIAEDNTEFDNETECMDYEWKLKHPHIDEIKCFDAEGNVLDDIMSIDTYGACMKIFVPTEECVKELYELTQYTGFYCYAQIEEPGTYNYIDKDEMFVLSSKED